jgi:hypothetical protein
MAGRKYANANVKGNKRIVGNNQLSRAFDLNNDMMLGKLFNAGAALVNPRAARVKRHTDKAREIIRKRNK